MANTRPPASPPARLALEDGTVFFGTAFGDITPKTVTGEACFNTSLSGYQEILTDPSYCGQIVAMTCPLIGNYGVNPDDLESDKVQCSGFVIRELAHRASNYRSNQPLEQWLATQGILGLAGIDTRALTRRLRSVGAMQSALSSDPQISDDALIHAARTAEPLTGRNLAAEVSRTAPLAWNEDLGDWAPLQGVVPAGPRRRVVALDCGAKLNIFRNLVDAGC
ncbi:MAG: carbamoyl-phosphate synthase domain-containing protein, partial [Algisphaera sp.]